MIALFLFGCGEDEAERVDAWIAANGAPERTGEVSVTAEFRCWRDADDDGPGVSIATLAGEAITQVVRFDGEVGSGEPIAQVRGYQAAWADLEQTEVHLAKAWAPGGRFVVPSADVKGRDRLEEHIATVMGNPVFGRVEFADVGGMDQQGDAFRFHWEMRGGAGRVWLTGYDYGVLDEYGRIELLVGCWER